MLSSTSSSNQRIPPAPYGRLWLLTVVVLLALGFGLEMTLNRLGHLKSLTDDGRLWSSQFDLIASNKADIALVGGSRLQLGFSAEHFGRGVDMTFANIAMGGESPVPSLRAVAEETGFDGLVICSLAEYHLFMDSTERVRRRVDDYKRTFGGLAGVNPGINRWLLSALQQNLVLFSSTVRLRDLAMSRRLLNPRAIQWGRDRLARGYYLEILSPERLEKARQNRLAYLRRVGLERTPDRRWERGLGDLTASVGRIRDRGGAVAFVRFPTSGEYDAVLRRAFPRPTFWDSIASRTGAEAVHFEDYPELSGFECPDGSHLTWNDARTFSAGLAGVLSERGLLVK